MMTRLLTFAALLAVPLFASAQQRNSSGFMLNVHMNVTSLAMENADTAESGLGLGFRFGWGVTKNVTLFAGIDSATIITEDPTIVDGEYGLMQANVGLIYNFRPGRTMLPYLEGAMTGWRITSRVGSIDPAGNSVDGDVFTRGFAATLGAGLHYYFAPRLAANAALSVTTGHFGDLRVNDTRGHNTDFSATSARLGLGLTWYPITGR